MDVIYSVKQCLSNWDRGGESECRTILTPPHCHLSEPDCVDVLAAVYQTLLHSALTTWPANFGLSITTLVAFIQSVLNGLPSSSSSSQKSFNDVLFGELLLDVIWATDAALEEVLVDAKYHITVTEAGEASSPTAATQAKEEHSATPAVLVNANKAKEAVEMDKGRLADFIGRLLSAKVVEPSKCRERLDMTLLNMVGLIPDKVAFEKKEIRTKTALFYKQNKFNLLREQSEGYTKLTTDLIGSLGPPHASSTGLPTESYASVEARARLAWDRVLSFIGYFDLDPNRTLDIILDVFSVNLATHWQFFLSLLSFSPWCGRFIRTKNWETLKEGRLEPDKDHYRGKTIDEVLKLAETAAEGIAIDSGSSNSNDAHVLAQVLGFKFAHYQNTDVPEDCPKSLYLTAALLIRQNFITLEELYPHLGPSDDEMPKFKHKYMQDVNSRITASSNNLLAMAAPLESNSTSRTRANTQAPASSENKKALEVKEEADQKAMLLIALLSVGAFRPALAILTKFPFLVDAHREIADLILRVLRISIAPLYDRLFAKERNLSFCQPRPRYATGGVVMPPPRKSQLTLTAPSPPSTHTQDFVFFFPHWAERVPLCTMEDDLMNVIEPLLRLITLYASRDMVFLTKLLRIGKVQLAETVTPDPDAKRQAPIAEAALPVQEFWLRIARRSLLPALSMIPGNAICTVEVWNILKQFDTTVRWRLYGEWRDVTYGSHPELKVQRALREREAKGILRRLSSQTVEALAGTVAKMAHSNPCIFFANAVNQIQAYENLTDVVIQALRYATNMGFDVLVFIILDALANPQKDRVKDDGVYASDWLQNLATFTGSLFRRYSSDLTPLLKYIVHQLYNGQTTEIIVLEKLVLKMAGIEPLPTLSDAQITAMAGGPILRIEAVASDLRGAGFDASEAALKGTLRLGKALVDSRLAFPLLVQVAQQRQACVFRTKDAYLKSIGYLFDSTHGVLFQYLDLLTTPAAVSFDKYRSAIPPLAELGILYGISAPIALQVIRPMLNDAIRKHADEWKASKIAANTESAEAAEKRLKAALAAKREPSNPSASENNGAGPAEASTNTPNGVAEREGMVVDFSAGSNEQIGPAEAPWIPELYALFDDCKQIATGNAYDVIGAGFYMSFWQMSSYDLVFPKAKYDETEKQLLSAAENANVKYRQADRSSDRLLRQSAMTYRSQRDRYYAAAAELKQERETQETVVRYTSEKGGRLDKEKAHWFSHVGSGKVSTFVMSLIEHCIQPRCLLSPMDADYCARLIKALHERGTPGFHTLMCYDRLLGDHVKVVIFSCSENEARNYGRFLKGILQDLYNWHKDQRLYEASLRVKDGSNVSFLPGLQKTWKVGTVSQEDLLEWTGFKSFLKKCHRKLGKSFTDCIQAGDFMHVYNAVLVLKEILEVFPLAAVNEVVGSSIDLEIQRLVQSEERGDLKILARAYSSGLKRREELWALPKSVQPILKATLSTAPKADAPRTLTVTPSQPLQRPAAVTNNVPAGPRAQQSATQQPSATEMLAMTVATDGAVSTKQALESIPKPEVVKRIRTDNKSADAQDSDAERKAQEPMQVDQKSDTAQRVPKIDLPLKEGTPVSVKGQTPQQPHVEATSALRRDLQTTLSGQSRAGTPVPMQPTPTQGSQKDLPPHRPLQGLSQRTDSSSMPPPPTPSQTQSTQEHRILAKQVSGGDSSSQNLLGVDDQNAIAGVRSVSPSRPGTRATSADSRGSGGRVRTRTIEVDIADEGKRTAWDASARSERGERSGGAHRDVLHGRSERNGRERERIPGSSSRDGDRDREPERGERDRGRERGEIKERDRERDREREKRKDRERDGLHRERDRERDKDVDRTSDRHRREEREREREQRREARNAVAGASREGDATSEHSALRPDASRHRGGLHADETLGKRRRPADDEPERSSKRGSRSHREDRVHRSSDTRDASRERTRDSERRRKERDAPEFDTVIGDKPPDRSSRQGEPTPSPTTAKSSGPPPSAPRAMATSSPRHPGRRDSSPVAPSRDRERVDRERGDRTDWPERMDRGDREWKTNREAAAVASYSNAALPNGSYSGGREPIPSPVSLRSRISDFGSQTNTPPREGGFGRGGDDHGDGRKRTLTERERDALLDAPLGAGLVSSSTPGATGAPKRPRILRNRYGNESSGGGLARRVLHLGGTSGTDANRGPDN